ncbi:MAG: ABC transporter ATP-binding protein [Propionibacteriaceae bacterium]|jgi:putative ABC transport system ATP-binding protein|nr:ABC transporter ATP-binding protein [Propionibacteriaceae bacterium]
MGGEQRAVVSARRLTKTFASAGGGRDVLNAVSLDIRAGDFTVIMGASGAGKSTLLYALSGMDRPTAGRVTFAGQDLSGLNESGLARFRRRHAGFVFQQIYLLDNLSLLDNAVVAGLLVTQNKAAIAARALALFERVRLDRDTILKLPSQVSGGEAQRAGIVRALINRPAVLFADEPTGALDQTSGTAVLDVLSAVHRSGQTVVMVTHDLKSARRGNRILFLRDGEVTGDLDLPPYRSRGGEERNARLRAFLDGQGW